MTSDESRRQQMLDAKDDMMILSDIQIAHLHGKLDVLRRDQRAIEAAIDGIETRLHQSGEARLRKLRRHNHPVVRPGHEPGLHCPMCADDKATIRDQEEVLALADRVAEEHAALLDLVGKQAATLRVLSDRLADFNDLLQEQKKHRLSLLDDTRHGINAVISELDGTA